VVVARVWMKPAPALVPLHVKWEMCLSNWGVSNWGVSGADGPGSRWQPVTSSGATRTGHRLRSNGLMHGWTRLGGSRMSPARNNRPVEDPVGFGKVRVAYPK
jgi:hypothetical protein